MSLWFHGATRKDGPDDKHGYSGVPEPLPKLGAVYHSMEGSMATALRMLANPAVRASWTFSNGKDGTLLAHYSADYHVWTNGSKESNTKFVGVENEGKAGEKLTKKQVDNLVVLTVWFHDVFKWPRIKRQEQLWEHNEMTRFGSAGTACPSDRIPWVRIQSRAEAIINALKEDDMTFIGVGADEATIGTAQFESWRLYVTAEGLRRDKIGSAGEREALQAAGYPLMKLKRTELARYKV